ncbi:uncharacterized protein LOC128962808 [Oppia nitens]|uniref:uncharacterized protein LOC128962808 n=1 Tax=Oppia nitens TaxID=1686743 RepID=UPI0023DAC9F5|nr:uncharacterized protein LOC128962808 [Oppia nitens]
MRSIYLIALSVSMVLTIKSLAIIESEDFCDVYAKNDYKIDFAVSLYKQYGYPQDMILLFIGKTYWKLSFIDGIIDGLVTIDSRSAGRSDWWFADEYIMVGSYITDANNNNKQQKDSDHPICYIVTLQKQWFSINWYEIFCNNMGLNRVLTKASHVIDNDIVDNDWKPDLMWIIINRSNVQCFADNNNYLCYWINTTDLSLKRLNNFSRPNWMFGLNNIITISQQYTNYCNNNNKYNHCMKSSSNGYYLGSIVFMNVQKTIQYCFTGNYDDFSFYPDMSSFKENNWRDDHNNNNNDNIIAITEQYIDDNLGSIIFMSDNKTIQ